MKRLLLPLFLKFAKLLGIDEIQSRLDETHKRLEDISSVLPRIHDAHKLATDAFTVAQFTERRSADYTNEIAHNLTVLIQELQVQSANNFEQNSVKLAELRLNIDSLRRAQSSEIHIQRSADPTPLTESPTIDEVLYLALEDRFRGERDLVAERQSAYVTHLGDKIDSTHPLVDLGCGRGEWLKILQNQGISVVGVDGNSVCVAECLENDLDVTHEDILTFLHKSKDASFGAVTLFQVFEHLPFNVLLDALREIYRVLTPGGVLIAEIPNSKNVRVGSGTFWIDPTHQRPLFPDVLMFLAEQTGFGNVDGMYVNRLGPNHDLSGLPDGAFWALSSVLDALDGPGDFALIAKR